MCLYPRLITNPKYKPNKKNGGVIPPVYDERVKLVPIGCQRCIECRKQKARGWQIRLLEDIKTNKNAKFITLTFSDKSIKHLTEIALEKFKNIEGYELDNAIATIATRLFLERWRKKYKKSLRHWLVTELGHNGTENIHMHGLIWTDETKETVNEIWNYGYTWYGNNKECYVNNRTINYIVKYIYKLDDKHKQYQSRILTSAGIGNNYINTHNSKNNKFNGTKTNETYRTDQGYKIAMPIYWRNKIYTEKEREQLWIQRLDTNERWICGENVKADDETTIYKLLEFHRNRNKQLGYGTDEKEWSQIHYENERRKLLHKKRLERVLAFGPK